MIKAVIFDMDGLMFDTEKLNAASWKEAGKLHGYDITDELLASHIGATTPTSKKLMLEHFGPEFDFDAIREYRIAFSLKYIKENGTPLKPGLRELLAYLDEKKIKTAVGSSNWEKFVSFYLERAALEHKFDVMITADKVEKGKPDPEVFLTALDELGLSAGECLVLEDSYNGIIAAHRAGIRSVMIPDLLPPTPEMEKLFFRKAGSLTDVIPIIEALNGERACTRT